MHRPNFLSRLSLPIAALKAFLLVLLLTAGSVAPLFPARAETATAQQAAAAAGEAADAKAAADAVAKASENTTLSADEQIFATLASIASWVAGAIGFFIITVLDVTIPIMQYQGFTSSQVVSAGWAIVRDTVNMFFVVILIVIAMGTIFGSQKFNWRQQVPKLMLMAIVINFSKTLCGLMIDFAQVIMLTFANALKDIAGGNFIQLLGLGPIMQLSNGGPSTIGSFDLFAASAAAVLMMVWVLAIVIMLMFILIYRVVMLWILIVVAPLAWFTSVVPFGSAKEAYGEWWKNFVCYCSVGPVITFFLWLTLAVAGAGSIAATDTGFSATGVGEMTNSAGGLSQIFELKNLTSFVIGMALLVAGMDAAAKVCAGVKGSAMGKMLSATKGGGFINQWAGGQARKYGEKGGKWAGGKVKAGGMALAGGAGNLALGAGAGALAVAGGVKAKDAFSMTRAGQAARAEGLRGLSKKLPGSLAGTSRALSMSADARQAELAETMKKAVGEEYKGASDETKVDELIRMANGGGQAFEGAASSGLLAEALKNPKMREKLEAAGVLKKFSEKGKKGEPSQIDRLKAQLKGTKEFDAIEDFEKGRPDLTGKIATLDSTNSKDLDVAAYTDPAVVAQLAKIDSDIFDKTLKNSSGTMGRYLTEKEAVEKGKRGKKKQDALIGGKTGFYETLSPANLSIVPKEDLAANISPALLSKRPDAASTVLSSNRPGTRAKVGGQPAVYRAAATQELGLKFDSAGKVSGANINAMKAALKTNPSAFANIPTSDIEGDPALSGAIASALDDKNLASLAKQYEKASADEREEMDEGGVMNALVAMDKTASTTNPAFKAVLEKRMETFHKALVAVEGNKLNLITKLDTKITTADTNYRGAVASGNMAAAARYANQRNRLTERRDLHARLP